MASLDVSSGVKGGIVRKIIADNGSTLENTITLVGGNFMTITDSGNSITFDSAAGGGGTLSGLALASYLIVNEGGTYNAYNGMTGTIDYTSTFCSSVLGDVISNTEGGMIGFKAGQYTMTSDVIVSGGSYSIYGEGWSSSIILGFNGTIFHLDTPTMIHDLYFDGDRTTYTNTTNTAIYVDTRWCIFDRLNVVDFAGKGIMTHDRSAGDTGGRVVTCRFATTSNTYSPGSDGIYLDNPDWEVAFCVINNLERGIVVNEGNVRLAINHVWGCKNNIVLGDTTTSTSANQLIGNVIENSRQHGLFVEKNLYDSTFYGNIFYLSGRENTLGPDLYSDVYIHPTSAVRGITFMGNAFWRDTIPLHNIDIADGSRISIVGNSWGDYLPSSGTKVLLTNCVNMTVRNNTGFFRDHNEGSATITDGLGTIPHECSIAPNIAHVDILGTVPTSSAYTLDSTNLVVRLGSTFATTISWEVKY